MIKKKYSSFLQCDSDVCNRKKICDVILNNLRIIEARFFFPFVLVQQCMTPTSVRRMFWNAIVSEGGKIV